MLALLLPPCIVPSFLKFVSEEPLLNSIAISLALLGLTEPLFAMVKEVLSVLLTVIFPVWASLTVPQVPLIPQPLI